MKVILCENFRKSSVYCMERAQQASRIHMCNQRSAIILLVVASAKLLIKSVTAGMFVIHLCDINISHVKQSKVINQNSLDEGSQIV